MESDQPNWAFVEPMEKPRWLNQIIAMTGIVVWLVFFANIILSCASFGFPPINLAILLVCLAIQYAVLGIENAYLQRIEYIAIPIVIAAVLCLLLALRMIFVSVDSAFSPHVSRITGTIILFPTTVLFATGVMALAIRRQYAVWRIHERGRIAVIQCCKSIMNREFADRGIVLSVRHRKEFRFLRMSSIRITDGVSWQILNWIELAYPDSDGVRRAWSLAKIVGDRAIPDFPIARLNRCLVFGFSGDDPIALDVDSGKVIQFVIASGELIKRSHTFSVWCDRAVVM